MGPACFSPDQLVGYYLAPEWINAHCRFLLGLEQEYQPIPTGQYLLAFLMTNLLEMPIYYLFWKKLNWSWKRQLTLLLGLNLATHPFVVLGVTYWGAVQAWRYAGTLAFAEGFALVVEALILTWVSKSVARAFFAALSANIFSWWIGAYFF